MNSHDHLVSHLQDAHTIELQALTQMRKVAEITLRIPQLRDSLSHHIARKTSNERLIRERLMAYNKNPLFEGAQEHGFALFSRLQPETPSEFAAHTYSYDQLGAATLDMLSQVAEYAGDKSTFVIARQICAQEEDLAEQLENCLDSIISYTEDQETNDFEQQLTSCLGKAYAIEEQSIGLLRRAVEIPQPKALRSAYEEHIQESESQHKLISELLEDRDIDPLLQQKESSKLGSINLDSGFSSQAGNPAKLAAFVYAFEHLEIAEYEELYKTAEKAEDEKVYLTTKSILEQEQNLSERLLNDFFDDAIRTSLQEDTVS